LKICEQNTLNTFIVAIKKHLNAKLHLDAFPGTVTKLWLVERTNLCLLCRFLLWQRHYFVRSAFA